MRSEFERLVDATVGVALAAYGFRLAPQPPGDLDERFPRAIYETTPETFERNLPKLAAHWDIEADCVDLIIEGHPRLPLLATLEGEELVRAPLGSLAPALAQALGAYA